MDDRDDKHLPLSSKHQKPVALTLGPVTRPDNGTGSTDARRRWACRSQMTRGSEFWKRKTILGTVCAVSVKAGERVHWNSFPQTQPTILVRRLWMWTDGKGEADCSAWTTWMRRPVQSLIRGFGMFWVWVCWFLRYTFPEINIAPTWSVSRSKPAWGSYVSLTESSSFPSKFSPAFQQRRNNTQDPSLSVLFAAFRTGWELGVAEIPYAPCRTSVEIDGREVATRVVMFLAAQVWYMFNLVY